MRVATGLKPIQFLGFSSGKIAKTFHMHINETIKIIAGSHVYRIGEMRVATGLKPIQAPFWDFPVG